jgi:hypothetical protein
MSGLVTLYVLFFIHLGSRRVWLAGCTPQPHAAWMAQQARNFSMVVEDWGLRCRYLVHDRDTSFAALDGVLKTKELHILKTPPHSPLCNAYAERHVREIRETLDDLILCEQCVNNFFRNRLLMVRIGISYGSISPCLCRDSNGHRL